MYAKGFDDDLSLRYSPRRMFVGLVDTPELRDVFRAPKNYGRGWVVEFNDGDDELPGECGNLSDLRIALSQSAQPRAGETVNLSPRCQGLGKRSPERSLRGLSMNENDVHRESCGEPFRPP